MLNHLSYNPPLLGGVFSLLSVRFFRWPPPRRGLFWSFSSCSCLSSQITTSLLPIGLLFPVLPEHRWELKLSSTFMYFCALRINSTMLTGSSWERGNRYCLRHSRPCVHLLTPHPRLPPSWLPYWTLLWNPHLFYLLFKMYVACLLYLWPTKSVLVRRSQSSRASVCWTKFWPPFLGLLGRLSTWFRSGHARDGTTDLYFSMWSKGSLVPSKLSTLTIQNLQVEFSWQPLEWTTDLSFAPTSL